jgi:hypothetical protein
MCGLGAQLDRSAVRQAAEEDTLYRGVAAPSRVQVAEEPVVTEVPKVPVVAVTSAAAAAPAILPAGQCLTSS